ncbi:hypothetical protein ES707_18785 [subsurface metagenome]
MEVQVIVNSDPAAVEEEAVTSAAAAVVVSALRILPAQVEAADHRIRRELAR